MKNYFSNFSDEKLIKTEKIARTLYIIFSLALMVLTAVSVYLIFNNPGRVIFALMPAALLPVYIMSFNNWRKMRVEMKTRNLL